MTNNYVLHRLQQSLRLRGSQSTVERIKKHEVPEHLIALIKSLYTNQEAALRKEYGDTEWFEVRKGVRQGCILSPYLFNMYSEYIVRKVGFEDNIGIKIGWRTINNL